MSVEGTVISKVGVQNGNCNRGMVSQNYGEISKLSNEEMPVGKPNGNRRSSLGNERRNLSVVKIGTEGETNTGTAKPSASASKKTSQIKKSLQSFGKLINGGVKKIISEVEVESSPPVTVCRIERRLSSGGQSQRLSNSGRNSIERKLTASGSGLLRRDSIEGKEKFVEAQLTRGTAGV